MTEPSCAFVDCQSEAVGSRAVRGTVWFASHSRLSPANGDESHWEVGGTVLPIEMLISIHVCEEHNAVTQEAPIDLG